MIPLRSDRRSSSPPVAVWLLAVACSAALIRLATLPEERASQLLTALAVVPSRLVASWSPEQLLTLITSAFLHAGWVHLGSNLLYLLVFGPAVQAALGWRRFLALYLACGAISSLAFALTYAGSSVPLVGASGAIAGVLGAHMILEPRARITTLIPVVFIVEIASLPAAFVIAVWFALQVTSLVTPMVPQAGATVAWLAHVAGFIVGMTLAAPTALRKLRARRHRERRADSADSRRAR